MCMCVCIYTKREFFLCQRTIFLSYSQLFFLLFCRNQGFAPISVTPSLLPRILVVMHMATCG